MVKLLLLLASGIPARVALASGLSGVAARLARSASARFARRAAATDGRTRLLAAGTRRRLAGVVAALARRFLYFAATAALSAVISLIHRPLDGATRLALAVVTGSGFAIAAAGLWFGVHAVIAARALGRLLGAIVVVEVSALARTAGLTLIVIVLALRGGIRLRRLVVIVGRLEFLDPRRLLGISLRLLILAVRVRYHSIAAA